MSEIVRVLRVIEYVGKREHVEEAVAKALHGERKVEYTKNMHKVRGVLTIKAATIGVYPEILQGSDDE